jgi:hypothetical protein
LDSKISDGVVTVKQSQQDTVKDVGERAQSLLDPRVNSLIEFLNARSRTSEQQPSLRYIRDAAQNLNVAVSRRHHLIFGRRGVGKTALMLEAKNLLEKRGALTFWINIQTMRSLSAVEAFLTLASRLCDLPEATNFGHAKQPLSIAKANAAKIRISELLGGATVDARQVNLLLPELQQVFHLLGQETKDDLYLFLDDWPAPGSEDTKLGVLMEREVRHGAAEVYAGVQA